MRKIFVGLLFLTMMLVPIASGYSMDRTRTESSQFALIADGKPAVTFVPLGAAAECELVTNAFDWINRYLENSHVPTIATGTAASSETAPVFAAYGKQGRDLLGNKLNTTELPSQGFIIQRLPDAGGLVVWSPSELGLRYGLIELLRSLQTTNNTSGTAIEKVIDWPEFDKRIYYVNFASHLQNAYNVNAVFNTDLYKWSEEQWFALVDNISSLRYNYFEFWLVPALMSPEVFNGGKLQTEFAATMNKVIRYAKSRGVTVHPVVAINTVGIDWHYHCPNVPAEKAELLAIWEYWIKTLHELESWQIGTGDPGGCTKNGCTKKTYVDLALEVAQLIKKLNPKATIEVATWGEPMAGWGIPLWSTNEAVAKEAMDYFISKIPEFPKGTFVNINRGFSPDCIPNILGREQANCDGRVWAKQAAELCPVLTWDYSVTEGEETVYPHCRLRRQLAARHSELEAGCYSGGIAYTMAPQLQLCSQFCAAESFWNPHRTPEEILALFGRLAFGPAGEKAGLLLEEFECLPGWGYEPAPFPFTPERLFDAMTKLLAVLQQDDLDSDTQIPFAVSGQQYKETLIFFTTLFRDLADLSISLNKLTALAKEAGGVFADVTDQTPFATLEKKMSEAGEFPQREQMIALIEHIKALDAPGMKDKYWKNVYGIYDVVDAPIDPRSWAATNTLMNRFKANRIVNPADSPRSRLQ